MAKVRQPPTSSGVDRTADGVTYDPTGPSIEDRSQVHKAGRDCDIGDVGYPQLVRTIQFHVLREIGEDRITVIAIRGRDKTPALPWIQRKGRGWGGGCYGGGR